MCRCFMTFVTFALVHGNWRQEVLWHRRVEQADGPIQETLTLSIMEGLPTSLPFLNPSGSFLPSSSRCRFVCDYSPAIAAHFLRLIFSFVLRLYI